MGFYIMLCTIHTTPRPGTGEVSIPVSPFPVLFPVPFPVLCSVNKPLHSTRNRQFQDTFYQEMTTLIFARCFVKSVELDEFVLSTLVCVITHREGTSIV